MRFGRRRPSEALIRLFFAGAFGLVSGRALLRGMRPEWLYLLSLGIMTLVAVDALWSLALAATRANDR